MDIKKKVELLIQKHQSRNPFEIIKGMNIILIFIPLVGVKGFYQYFQRNHIIYIDENLSDTEKLFVCAHELGHMLLHKKINVVFMDSRTFMNISFYENEANKFAVNLLISDDEIHEYLFERQYTTDMLARLWGCQKELIELRLK